MKAIQPIFSYPSSVYEMGNVKTSFNPIFNNDIDPSSDIPQPINSMPEKLSTLEKFYQLFSNKKDKGRTMSVDQVIDNFCSNIISIPKAYSESAECQEVRNILSKSDQDSLQVPPIGSKIDEDEISAESAYNSSSSLTISPTSCDHYQRLSVYKNVLNVLGEEENDESVFVKQELLAPKNDFHISEKAPGANHFKPIRLVGSAQIIESQSNTLPLQVGYKGRIPFFSTPSPSAFLISPLYADFDKLLQSSTSACESQDHFAFDNNNFTSCQISNDENNQTIKKLVASIQTTKSLFDQDTQKTDFQSNIVTTELNTDKSNKIMCSLHYGQSCIILCQDCIMPLCHVCLNPPTPFFRNELDSAFENRCHDAHTLVYIGNSRTILAHQVDKIQSTLLKMAEQIITDRQIATRINERAKSIDTAIDTLIEANISTLRSRQVTLHARVRDITSSKLLSVRDQIGSLNRYQGYLNESLRLSNVHMSAVGANNNALTEILATSRNLKCRMKNMSSILQGLLQPWEDDSLDFKTSTDPRLLDTIFENLGQIQGPASALNSTLYSMRSCVPPRNSLIHKPISIILKTRDHSGEIKIMGGDVITCFLTDSSGNKKSVLPTDLCNGSYIFSFTPTLLGRYSLEVYIRGKAVSNSPLLINIRPCRNYLAIKTAIFGFGKEGNLDGELCRPWGVTCDAIGNLYVADRSNNRIQIYDMKGNFIRKFGSFGTAPGQFNRPAGIAVNGRNELIIADKDNHRVQVFTTEGKFLFAFGDKGSKPGQFNYPWDIAINSSETKIVVSDTRNHRIQLFLPDGTFIGKYGLIPPYCRHFDSPRGVTFGLRDEILVTDFNNHRCFIIDNELKEFKTIGKEGSALGDFFRPQGLAVDLEGNIIIADSRNHRIQVFDANGYFVSSFGQNGPRLGEFDRPSGICLSPEGYVIVVDFGNNRVQIF